jgi:hypothetical protein
VQVARRMPERDLDRLSKIEQWRFKKAFSASLCNLSQIQMYWSPSRRRIIARAVVTEIRARTLPADAVLIGTYSHPFNVNDFLGDLEDVLAKLAHDAATITATAAACAG